jgi:hypothetical protein
MKTSELTGAALDWAVAIALGKRPSLFIFEQTGLLTAEHHYSINWSRGGPIIERERITLRVGTVPGTRWVAFYDRPDRVLGRMTGPTALHAAMRCFVSVKLGGEVEIPKELQ